MDIGLSTQNLTGIVTIILLSVLNVYGVKLGALVQNVFTFAKTAALLGLVLLGITIGRNATALAANFHGHFFQNAGWSSLHAVQVGAGGPIAMVITATILAVAQVGSLFSADAWNNVTFTAGEVKNPQRNLPLSLALGTGIVITLYCLSNLVYLLVLPLGRRSSRHHPPRARHSIRHRRPRRHRRYAADLRRCRRQHHGGAHPDFHLRM